MSGPVYLSSTYLMAYFCSEFWFILLQINRLETKKHLFPSENAGNTMDWTCELLDLLKKIETIEKIVLESIREKGTFSDDGERVPVVSKFHRTY